MVLTRHLEHQVLIRNRSGIKVAEGDLVFLVVLPDEVHHNGAGLPDCDVVVLMVNDCWQASIWVLVGVRCLFMLHCMTKN